MLSYTMSEDGHQARIGPCIGGRMRLSIIRICKQEGWDIPPGTLDEESDIDALADIYFKLEIHRNQLQQERRAEVLRQKQVAQAERERRLPPDIAAKVVELREYAASIREAALRADRNADMRRELAKAKCIEADASALIDSVK
jgi:hypothetical protein